MHLTNALRRARQLRGREIAIVDGEKRWTWNEYVGRVERLAGGLRSLGMQRGDRIAVLANNSHRYIEAYFGSIWAGGCLCPVNIRHSVAEIVACLDDSEAGILLIDRAYVAMLPEIRRHSATLSHVVFADEGSAPEGTLGYEELLAASQPAEDALCGGDDVACLYYTGGTTGKAKGVMLTHDNLWWNAVGTAANIVMHEGSITLQSGPLFHLAAGSRVYGATIAGATHIVLPRFSLPEVLQTIEKERITHATFVPTMINSILNWPELDRYDLTSLRLLSYGASPMPEALIVRLLQVLPGCQLVQSYGMTELSPVATMLRHEDHLPADGKGNRRRSAGRPIPSAEVKVVDAEGRELPIGQVGEVAVRGPMVMKGYWKQPELTAQVLRGGWMHTGDAGYFDDEGYLFVVDRIKDMVISGGENIYSAEVENALYKHPDIAECAVIGIPDEKWGETVHAIVVAKEGRSLQAADIIVHCQKLIARYKCPKSVEISVEALPKSGAGKILKATLRERFWQGQARRVS